MSKRKWFFVSQCLVACALIIVLLISILGVPWVQAWSSDPSENTAVCIASDDQEAPVIVSDGSGGAIITWEDQRSGTDWDIYAQRVDSSGIPQWTANGVAVCTASDNNQHPAVVSDGAGGIIITWFDYRSGTDWDIYAQRVDSSGIPQWTTDGVAICTASNSQLWHEIVSDGSGGAIIVWQDYRGGNTDIYAQWVNPSGVPQWTANGVAVCTAQGDQWMSVVVADGEGGAIVTWSDNRSGLYSDIYAQRVNPSGVPQWTANGVAICTASDGQWGPTIVSDGSGGAIISWEDYRGDTYDDIYAQRVNPSGVPQWTANGVAVCTAQGNQEYHAVVSDGSGGAFITWQDERSDSEWHIYAQRFDTLGLPQWTANGVAVCTASLEQWLPTIVSDGSGGAIITWEDYRSGENINGDIYAQRVNADGLLQDPTHTWPFCTAGFFPAHMPDSYSGEVVLADLNPTTIPPEVQGVYWYDCSTSDWKFWAPGVPGTTLTNLGGGHTYDYMVTVTGSCDWEIPIDYEIPTPMPPPSDPHNWSSCYSGFFPQHLSDSYSGQVVLADLVN
ncbi:MAG: hypothetical protein RI591_05985, partial [Dehalococcoidia bacterium]|nr:hypothetical protein [Dehalococcoidia bacterium]